MKQTGRLQEWDVAVAGLDDSRYRAGIRCAPSNILSLLAASGL
jgi:hypothetical protein